MLLCGRYCIIHIRIHIVEIGSERNDVVVVIRAVGGRSVVIRLQLILFVDSGIVRLGLNLVVGLVKHRSLCPIAEECEEWNIEVYFRLFGSGKLYKPLNEHTVREKLIYHLLIRIRHSVGCADLDGRIAGYGKCAAGNNRSAYRKYGFASKYLSLFCHVVAV